MAKLPSLIPFNKPYLSGKETNYLIEAVNSGKISGNGIFTKKCHHFFEQRYGFKKTLLTTSCTDALEMAAILLDLEPGDEVIMPSYTFVSTANAFILRGATLRFADSGPHNPNIDPDQIEELITSKTKAIVVVHYAGVACDMDRIMGIANKHGLFVVEDAAQAIDSYYNDKPLGSIGHLAAFSFHETKNIISGEGGMLVINDEQFIRRAEIIWEKGTNRSAFFRGEIDKYSWVDIGSSFLPSEIVSAFLFAQLENLDDIQATRRTKWEYYQKQLYPLAEKGYIGLANAPNFASNNAHLFYILCKDGDQRDAFLKHMKQHNILAVFHYLSLHKSPFYLDKHDGRILRNCERYADCLVRLPLFYELASEEQAYITQCITQFFIDGHFN